MLTVAIQVTKKYGFFESFNQYIICAIKIIC
ncbi:MAG: hypothetical protein ACI9LX_004794 [Paraglaciecola sp.]|jgi:hypothetical protein